MKKITLIVLIVTLGSQQPVISQEMNPARIVADGAVLQLIDSGFSFTEGPAVDKKGNIFFTDQPNDRIWKYGTDGKLAMFLDNTGRSNGLYFDKKGNIIACADANDEMWQIAPDKKVKVLFKDLHGQKLNGPNDLWIHSSGRIYFTDPFYKRDYWTRKAPDIKIEGVYYFSPADGSIHLLDSTLKKPNGIVGTPDGKYLYVADIGAGKTYKYTIEKNGDLSEKKLFVTQGSDGMTLDNQGNLYLTGKGVTVYDSTGSKIAHIDVPAPWTANLCFGGPGRNRLFITASKSFFVIDMKVKGVE